MRIYANLLGTWTDITETGTVADNQNPVTYFKENLKYNGNSKVAKCFEFGYIEVQYNGVGYRLAPEHIQITNRCLK